VSASVVDGIVERTLRQVPKEPSILDKLFERDKGEGTPEPIAQWRMSLARAEGRVAVAKMRMRTEPTNGEHAMELAAATGAATYCREWLKEHKR
jgi:hypothetical protein